MGDGVRDEFVAMVNYAVMALIQQELEGGKCQLECGKLGEAPMELPLKVAMKLYDKHITRILDLMILMKLLRIKQIEDNEGRTLVSEGVEGGYMDIVNYSLFCLVRLTEEEKN